MSSTAEKVFDTGSGQENLAAVKLTNDKDVVWYKGDIDGRVTLEVRNLLENYSKIPPSQVISHIREVRDKCWAIRAYPCTGLGLFLEPLICKNPVYPTILSRLKSGAKLLEIGCYVGTDLRHLVSVGVPSSNLVAIDIVSHWDVGYELFNDRDRFATNFIEAEVLDMEAKPELAAMKGSFDIIYVGQVLHQWLWDKQVEACKKIVAMAADGAMVVGLQIGSVKGDVEHLKTAKAEGMHFFHSPETFGRMWRQVGVETGTKWETECHFKSWEELGWDTKDVAYLGPNARFIEFHVIRVD